MPIKYVLPLLLVMCVVTAVVTRYYFPQVQTKTEVVEKEVVKNNVRTIIKEVVKSDGTKETVTEIVDKTERKEESKKSQIKIAKKDWMFGLTYNRNVSENISGYQLSVSRRQIGPFFLTGNVARFGNDTVVGAGLAFEY